MRLTFHGAAQTVTGSKYLLETKSHSLLVDCGLFQGPRELRERNWRPPEFDINSLDAIVLTHAHIDHTGYLPAIVRSGFNKPIYCTAATKELLKLLLPDSGHLQEEQARFSNKHKTSRHEPALPLYTESDARAALSLLRVIKRDEANEILPGISVTPSCAGHILGSCALSIDADGRRVTFSGDIGRYDTPLLPDPAPLDIGDLLLCESTYGDRLHKISDTRATLAKAVNSAVERKGPLLIPSFAIGRTQTLIYHLANLEREGLIPPVPVIIDSPMAIDATEIYRSFHFDFDEEAAQLLKEGSRPLKTKLTAFSKTSTDSKKLNTLQMPRIIISASGMVTGGRILHHMKHLLPKENTTVLFVGYQAKGTRGSTIQSGKESVKIFGQTVPIRAKVQSISGLSAHGDQSELLRWLRSCSGRPKTVKVIHGEPKPSRVFAQKLSEEFAWNATPAEMGETVEVS